jgi:hypothetical protein
VVFVSKYSAIIFLLSASFFAGAADSLGAAHVSYPERLQWVAEVDARFGVPEACDPQSKPQEMLETLPELEHFGLLGGIYLNTFQQMRTERPSLFIWNQSNSVLTVDVYHYMQAYLEGLRCEESPFIQKRGNPVADWQKGFRSFKVSHSDVCQSWYDYFKAVDKKQNGKSLPVKRLQRLLWRAHSYSLFHVWVLNYDEYYQTLKTRAVPYNEFYLWNSWNHFVASFLPSLNVNSCAQAMWPFLETAMPPCEFPGPEGSPAYSCTFSKDLTSLKEWIKWYGLISFTGFYHSFSELDDSIDAAAKEID